MHLWPQARPLILSFSFFSVSFKTDFKILLKHFSHFWSYFKYLKIFFFWLIYTLCFPPNLARKASKALTESLLTKDQLFFSCALLMSMQCSQSWVLLVLGSAHSRRQQGLSGGPCVTDWWLSACAFQEKWGHLRGIQLLYLQVGFHRNTFFLVV